MAPERAFRPRKKTGLRGREGSPGSELTPSKSPPAQKEWGKGGAAFPCVLFLPNPLRKWLKSRQQSPQKSSPVRSTKPPRLRLISFSSRANSRPLGDRGMLDGAGIHLTWEMTGPAEGQGRGPPATAPRPAAAAALRRVPAAASARAAALARCWCRRQSWLPHPGGSGKLSPLWQTGSGRRGGGGRRRWRRSGSLEHLPPNPGPKAARLPELASCSLRTLRQTPQRTRCQLQKREARRGVLVRQQLGASPS